MKIVVTDVLSVKLTPLHVLVEDALPILELQLHSVVLFVIVRQDILMMVRLTLIANNVLLNVITVSLYLSVKIASQVQIEESLQIVIVLQVILMMVQPYVSNVTINVKLVVDLLRIAILVPGIIE